VAGEGGRRAAGGQVPHPHRPVGAAADRRAAQGVGGLNQPAVSAPPKRPFLQRWKSKEGLLNPGRMVASHPA
jgi:hypothetical protein